MIYLADNLGDNKNGAVGSSLSYPQKIIIDEWDENTFLKDHQHEKYKHCGLNWYAEREHVKLVLKNLVECS